MTDDSFGVLPWRTEQFELQYKEFRETFPPEFYKFSEYPTLKIVHPAEGQHQSIFELERTVTTFLRYFEDLGNYDSVIWLGADNIAVTLNYLCLLLSNRDISVIKNGALRSISDVVSSVFDSVQSGCKGHENEDRKALVIYSAVQQLEAPDSWNELHPFLPDLKRSNIDLMILTLCPERFVNLITDPETDFMVPCRLQSDATRSSSSRTAEIRQEILQKNDESRAALEMVLLLVSFLYPNNMTDEFLAEAIEFIASGNPEDPELGVRLRHALETLIKSHVLRRVRVGGDTYSALCIDRKSQEQYRTSVDESNRKKMVDYLMRFFVDVVNERHLSGIYLNIPYRVLFRNYGSDHNPFLGTEVAMHQSWLTSVSAADLFPVKPENLVMDSVVEYVNLFHVGKISMFHRKEPLERSNCKVFEGYMYEAGAKTQIAVKCVPRQHRTDKKLKREIRSLRELNSTHVVGFFGVEVDPRGDTYLALEYCDQDLKKWVAARGHVDLTTVIEDLTQRFKLLRDATEGLIFLLSEGIIHRDVKPANILIKQKGSSLVAKLAGFDLSKYVGEDASATLTNPFGTRGYQAPNLRHGPRRGNHASDMYSFGKVCYFVLSCGRTHHYDNLGPIEFPFDFFGAAKTVETLLATDPAERPTAEALLKYPMFWMAYKCDHDKFADFIAKVIIEFGTDGSDFHNALRQTPVDWQTALKSKYGNDVIEEAINYRQGASPSKPLPSKKRKDGVGEEFGPDYAGYLRFTRNAIMHAVDRFRDTRSRVQLWSLYMDSYTGKPKKWEYFETYFKLFPEFFFAIWKLANDYEFNMSPDNFSAAFEKLCQVDCTE